MHEHLLAAVKRHFAHVAADPDQELADMHLTPGLDLSAFMHKFVRVHKASTIANEKAAMMLIVKFDDIREVYQSLLTPRLKNPDVTVEPRLINIQ
eukprot:scaffold170677_cov23-Tisochrysis_lutea.AAC.1